MTKTLRRWTQSIAWALVGLSHRKHPGHAQCVCMRHPTLLDLEKAMCNKPVFICCHLRAQLWNPVHSNLCFPLILILLMCLTFTVVPDRCMGCVANLKKDKLSSAGAGYMQRKPSHPRQMALGWGWSFCLKSAHIFSLPSCCCFCFLPRGKKKTSPSPPEWNSFPDILT